ncbi:MAG: ribonuclease P protein component [Solirubrobacterales bacterium]|nr:ribonuclease P protein component [Solirubrobacterales bacterium]
MDDDRSEARGRGRLSRSGDFDRVYREGSSRANRFLVLYAFPRSADDDAGEVRLGVSVGRRIGGAVERNKVKRAIRDAFWSAQKLPDGHDFVVVARRGVEGLVERDGSAGVAASLGELLGEAVPEDGKT